MLKLFLNWELNHLCGKFKIDAVGVRLPPLVPYATQTKETQKWEDADWNSSQLLTVETLINLCHNCNKSHRQVVTWLPW